MNIKKSLPQLEKYFQEEGNSPEVINNRVKHAALAIATRCNHPSELEAEDMEIIAMALEHLSDIVEIIDMYEDEKA